MQDLVLDEHSSVTSLVIGANPRIIFQGATLWSWQRNSLLFKSPVDFLVYRGRHFLKAMNKELNKLLINSPPGAGLQFRTFLHKSANSVCSGDWHNRILNENLDHPTMVQYSAAFQEFLYIVYQRASRMTACQQTIKPLIEKMIERVLKIYERLIANLFGLGTVKLEKFPHKRMAIKIRTVIRNALRWHMFGSFRRLTWLKLGSNYSAQAVLPLRSRGLFIQKPVQFALNSMSQPHCSTGPAIEYEDGFKLWFLNGVIVPQPIVETPVEKLKANCLLRIKNAEVRREIIRKIGIEKVCKELNAKVIDKEGDYELLLLDLQDGRHRPYLKMLNPSIGTYHLEGVDPGCITVEQALIWRNSSSAKPVLLT